MKNSVTFLTYLYLNVNYIKFVNAQALLSYKSDQKYTFPGFHAKIIGNICSLLRIFSYYFPIFLTLHFLSNSKKIYRSKLQQFNAAFTEIKECHCEKLPNSFILGAKFVLKPSISLFYEEVKVEKKNSVQMAFSLISFLMLIKRK